MTRAWLLATAVLLLAALPATARGDAFGGLVGVAPPPVKCGPPPCDFVDGDGTDQRYMPNNASTEITITPHVVRIGETFDLIYFNPSNPQNNDCAKVVSFTTFVSESGTGTPTVTCTFRATGATNFNEPGVGTGPGYLIKDNFHAQNDGDWYVITQNQFELGGKVLRGTDPPASQVTLKIEGPTNTTATTNADGEYSVVLDQGTYTVTPQGVQTDPVSRTVTLTDHQRSVDFLLSAEHIVNEAADAPDAELNGDCDVDAGADGLQCTLRAAIEEVNGGIGDRISFNVPGLPDLVVTDGPLPSIDKPVVIDASSQPVNRPAIIRGGDFSTDEGKAIMRTGLRITEGPTTLRHLNVRGFGDQVVVDAPGDAVTLDDMVLGTDRTGDLPAPELVQGFASVCSADFGTEIGGVRVFGAGVRATSARELAIERSFISLNPGCGVDLTTDVGQTRITNLRASRRSDDTLLGIQQLDIGGQASFVTIEKSLVATIEAANEAARWRITGTTAGKLVLNGDDHVVGEAGAGNGFGRVELLGDRNRFQGNEVLSRGGNISSFAITVRGAANQIGGAAEGERNLIEGGSTPRELQASDLVVGDGGVIDEGFGEINLQHTMLGGGLVVECPQDQQLACDRSALPPGADAGRGNVVQGNWFVDPRMLGGVVIRAPGTVVRGNRIERSDLGGIWVDGAGAIVEDNQVSGVRLGPGIYVASGTGHRILGNFLSGNGGVGIDLGIDDAKVRVFGEGLTPNDAGDSDQGPNGLQNYPELTSAVLDGGLLTLKGATAFPENALKPGTYQFFAVQKGCAAAKGEANGLIGEAELLDQPIDLTFAPKPTSGSRPLAIGMGVVGTATSPFLGTSELSPCVPVTGPATPAECKLKAGGTAQGLRLKVTCDQAALLEAGGTARIADPRGKASAAKVRKVRLKTVKKVVAPGDSATVKLKVPRKVRRAVRRGRRVSVRFRVTATTASGAKATARTTLKRLKRRRKK